MPSIQPAHYSGEKLDRSPLNILLSWAHCVAIVGLLHCVPAFDQIGFAEVDLKQLETHAITNAGDPRRGKAIFENSQKSKCIDCHKVDGRGADVGPDLSSIGGKFDRPHLIESLLEPSLQIVEGYRSSTVLTKDEQIITGIAKAAEDGSLTIVDANAKLHKVPKDDIQRTLTNATSIMPTGLADELSQDEFTDLVAYLETLRSGGKSGAGSDINGPIRLTPDFALEVIATGLTGATAMEILPDGRILVCEQTGAIRMIKAGKLLPDPVLTLPVNHEWERGVIGITVDPDFENSPFVYVCWTANEPYPHHRISRFLLRGDQAVVESEQVLLEGDDQTKLGGNVPAGHQGGALHFGTDGKLYVAIGEQTAGEPAQELDTLLGKILRINSDGSIPSDNPFLDQTQGKYRAIWTYGMRNPFTFAIRPSDGLMLINDVGGNFEEINVGRAGRNYGWPVVPHGRAKQPEKFEDPIHWYPEASISGGDFAPDHSRWPAEFQGKYFFADFKHGWIRCIDPEDGEVAEDFASGLRRPVDMRFSLDGRLLVLLRNAWVIDGKFEGGTSSLLAIFPKEQN